MVLGDRVMVVTFEEDMVFGGVANLDMLMKEAGAKMILEKGTWARAVEIRERLITEWEREHRQVVEDLNTMSATRVLEMTSVVLVLGTKGLVLWDSVMDCSYNRWKLQDVRDEVSNMD